ncbi:MAG: hypothetical protein KDD38_10330 [Bdellovibrionales bacterium]|nr:hypothetical protein [Bdellovibrionales bacterium]
MNLCKLLYVALFFMPAVSFARPLDIRDYEYLSSGSDSYQYIFRKEQPVKIPFFSIPNNNMAPREDLHPIERPMKEIALEEPQKFRTTHYHTPIAKEVRDGVDILVNATRGGPKISKHDFCVASMEGAIAIERQSGELDHYTFHSSNRKCAPREQNMCIVHRKRPLGCATFRPSKAPLGSRGQALRPYRTVAVGKHSHLKYGDVIYIEEADGALVTMPDGSNVQHDGFFKVGDSGSLPGQKLDIYIGHSYLRRPRAATFTNTQVTVRKVNL